MTSFSTIFFVSIECTRFDFLGEWIVKTQVVYIYCVAKIATD